MSRIASTRSFDAPRTNPEKLTALRGQLTGLHRDFRQGRLDDQGYLDAFNETLRRTPTGVLAEGGLPLRVETVAEAGGTLPRERAAALPEEITVIGRGPSGDGGRPQRLPGVPVFTGVDIGDMTGGFHLDLPSDIADIARASGVDIRVDENGDWRYRGRKIDDIAAEQGKTKHQVLADIFGTQVAPALPPERRYGLSGTGGAIGVPGGGGPMIDVSYPNPHGDAGSIDPRDARVRVERLEGELQMKLDNEPRQDERNRLRQQFVDAVNEIHRKAGLPIMNSVDEIQQFHRVRGVPPFERGFEPELP